MSPAGLKGVAEEKGLELVVVCSHGMGDIFRRNAFNLGLHVVQCPEAVDDAKDGDAFAFDPASRAADERDAGEDLRAGSALGEGGGDPLERRHLRRRAGASSATRSRAAPEVRFPDPDVARRMTTTEQIVWAHRVDRDAARRAGSDAARLRGPAARLRRHGARSRSTRSTRSPAGSAIYPRQAAIANDHFVFTGREDDDRQTSIGRAFARLHGLEKPYYASPGRRDLPLLLPRAGARPARAVHPGRRFAQPRLRRLRRGRVRRRLDHARLRLVDGLHLLHAREAAPRRLLAASSSPGSPARTSCSSCCAAGARSSRRECRSSSWTPSGSSRSRSATRSPT